MAMVTTTALPDLSAAVPGKVGYHAMSIHDYVRVDSARTEFLTFLLAPATALCSVADGAGAAEVERAA